MAEKNKRIVIKVGTSSLILPNGQTNLRAIDSLAFTLATLNHQGYEIILVSSGAMGVGLATQGLKVRPKQIAQQQVLSAIGQPELMRIYSQRFRTYQTKVGQLLITRDVFHFPVSRQHVLNTIATLLTDGVVPIINENDSVAVDELDHHTTFSDNDELSALVATRINANLLIILSDIDAFYDKDPHKYPDAQPIHRVKRITPEMKDAASGSSTRFGTGGMVTKLRAATTIMENNQEMVLCSGADPQIIFKVVSGEKVGTRFGK